jgi:hypothetical protein
MSNRPCLAMCREIPPVNQMDPTSWRASKWMAQDRMSEKKGLCATGITENVQHGGGKRHTCLLLGLWTFLCAFASLVKASLFGCTYHDAERHPWAGRLGCALLCNHHKAVSIGSDDLTTGHLAYSDVICTSICRFWKAIDVLSGRLR